MLGNNSHSFDKYSKNTIIGQETEPSMLHGHVIFRGDCSHEYIDGIKLEGVYPGHAIPVKSKHDECDEQDVMNPISWTEKQRLDALKYFKSKILRLKDQFNKVMIIDNSKHFEAKHYSNLQPMNHV